MKAVHWRHVRTEFRQQMARHVPEFEATQVRLTEQERRRATLDPGGQFFRRRVNDRLHCFVGVTPDARRERFWLTAGWSTLARIPSDAPKVSATEERKEFELAECAVEFERLFLLKHAVGPAGGWDLETVSVEFGDPGYVEALLEEGRAAVTEQLASERARQIVTRAVLAIKDVVIPYLEERIEWEREDTRRTRLKEWESFSRTREAFGVQLYGWARRLARREFEEGYPRVRAIADVSAWKFLEHMGALPRAEQARLADALVKRGFPTALRLVGESLTAEELALIERYQRTSLMAPVSRTGVNDTESLSDAQLRARARREAVWAQVKAELNAVLSGAGAAGPRPEQWRWDTALGGWVLRTDVFVWGGPSVRMIYCQSVALPGSPTRYLCTNMALLSWLGIANTTAWSLASEKEVQVAVPLLGRLCREFLTAAAEALAGLPSGDTAKSWDE